MDNRLASERSQLLGKSVLMLKPFNWWYWFPYISLCYKIVSIKTAMKAYKLLAIAVSVSLPLLHLGGISVFLSHIYTALINGRDARESFKDWVGRRVGIKSERVSLELVHRNRTWKI